MICGTTRLQLLRLPGRQRTLARFRPPTTDEPELRIQLEVPRAAPDELARFNQRLARHCYLEATRLVSEQLREVATDRGPWPVNNSRRRVLPDC